MILTNNAIHSLANNSFAIFGGEFQSKVFHIFHENTIIEGDQVTPSLFLFIGELKGRLTFTCKGTSEVKYHNVNLP